jgi:hypothetical protein
LLFLLVLLYHTFYQWLVSLKLNLFGKVGSLIAGMMAPEKSWCLVECPARWEPQEEGMMNTAARFSLS